MLVKGSSGNQYFQLSRKTDLVESRSGGGANCQGHSHKGIPMETICIRHHHDACDSHNGSHNLKGKITKILLINKAFKKSN